MDETLARGSRGTAGPIRAAFVSVAGKSLTQSPPIGLGYLAAVHRLTGGEARIFDFKRVDADPAILFAELVEFTPHILGITAATPDIPEVIRLVPLLRASLPGVPLVLGGAHATALPERALRETGVDAVVHGEGERVFPVLVDRLVQGDRALRDVPGVAFLCDGEVVRTPPAPFVEDLDELPMPAWDLIPPKAYATYTMQLFKRRDVVAPILTSRGCPYHCVFCASIVHGKRVRRRSPVKVVDEIEWLVREFGVGELQILDDNFTMDPRHAIAVCDEIVRRGLDVVWKMPQGMRADRVSEELVRALRRAGCYEVGFGVESGHQELLSSLNKQLDLARVHDSIALFKRHGIRVYGFFILGLPGETTESIRDTVRMTRAGFDAISLTYCVPYPGSELFARLVEEYGEPDNWHAFAHHRTFPLVSGMSDARLRHYWRWTILRFYASPSRFATLVNQVRSVPLTVTLRLFRNYFAGRSV